MAEINPEEVDSRKNGVVVVQAIQPHHALMKANRYLLGLVLVLMAIVFLLGFVLLPRQNMLETLGKSQAASVYATQNPALAAEISAIKGQMFGLVSGSIESKLRSLEDNIRRGSIAESLDTIQDLKSEVKILGSYSQPAPVPAEKAEVDQKVIKELSELKGLIYLTFVSCGLMIAAFAGVWLRQRRISHHQQHKGLLGRHEE